MTDAVFLRNLISNTIYAEQVNSAQIQGQQAAKERAVRVQQEAIKEQAETIERLEDAAELDVDGDGHQGQTYNREGQTEEEEKEGEAEPDTDSEASEQDAVSPSKHINLVI